MLDLEKEDLYLGTYRSACGCDGNGFKKKLFFKLLFII